MKKIVFIFHFSFFIFHFSVGQNLVPNYSFEDYSNCPDNINNQLSYTINWYSPSTRTPDYFNECSIIPMLDVPNNAVGFQFAKTGVAYAGISTYNYTVENSREYMSTKLIGTLEAGKNYCISFYVSPTNKLKYFTCNLGVYLSKDSFYLNATTSDVLPYTPQLKNPPGRFLNDTLNWMQISGIYKAVGGEKYITIGNFDDDAHTEFQESNFPNSNLVTYYYIDDVSITPLLEADAGHDTTLCKKDSVLLGSASLPGIKYQWQPATGLSNDSIAQPIATPSVSTVYTLTVNYPFSECSSLTSTVSITVNDCTPFDIFIPNSFSPNNDGINDTLYIRGTGIQSLVFSIYNRWGEKVFESTDISIGWDGTFNNQSLKNDVFGYTLEVTKITGEKISRTGSVSIIR